MTTPLNAPDCRLREFDLHSSEGYSSDLTHRDPRHRECTRAYRFDILQLSQVEIATSKIQPADSSFSGLDYGLDQRFKDRPMISFMISVVPP